MMRYILLLSQILTGLTSKSWTENTAYSSDTADAAADDNMSAAGPAVSAEPASSCRYTNVVWSDCDPLTWLRTKTVELVDDRKYRLVLYNSHVFS